jgi:hypothetical protein
MSKKIQIACQGATTLGLGEFTEFQGELKSLSKKEYQALRNQIEKQGFSFTVHVWQNGGKNYILDGHQRLRTIKTMVSEGWECPPLPVSLVSADSYEQAKRKLLSAASQYGKMESDGLLAYIQDMNTDAEELLSNFRFGDLDINKFIESNFDLPGSSTFNDDALIDGYKPTTETVFPEVSPGPEKPKKEAVGAQEFSAEDFDNFDHQCPRCGFEFDKK